MVNCSNEFLYTADYYSDISSDVPVIVSLCIGCILTVVCFAIYIEELIFLARIHHSNTVRLRQIVILLGLYPTICLTSVVSLLVPRSTVLVDLIASCYLSVCIYMFVHMTIDYFGGPSGMVETLSDNMIRLNTPPCCCCCCCICKPVQLTRNILYRIQISAIQVAAIRPALLFIAAVLWTDNKYDQKLTLDSGYLYITAITGISTLLSVYGMIVIFRAARPYLIQFRFTLKFAAIQIAVVLLNLQSFIFNTLANNDLPECVGTRGPRVRASNINHAISIVEAFLLALVARRAYYIDESMIDPGTTAKLPTTSTTTYGTSKPVASNKNNDCENSDNERF